MFGTVLVHDWDRFGARLGCAWHMCGRGLGLFWNACWTCLESFEIVSNGFRTTWQTNFLPTIFMDPSDSYLKAFKHIIKGVLKKNGGGIYTVVPLLHTRNIGNYQLTVKNVVWNYKKETHRYIFLLNAFYETFRAGY